MNSQRQLHNALGSPRAKRLARAWGEERGWRGNSGGWIRGADGRAFCQGWAAAWSVWTYDIADWLTNKLTAFRTLREMAEARGGYTPTIRERDGWQYAILADLYDAYQTANGDDRRAYRGS